MTEQVQRSGALSAPDILHQMYFSFAPSFALTTGVQLNVFSSIAHGSKTVPEIAQAAQASPRAMGMLLDALAAFNVLTKREGRYELTPLAADLLVRESSNYMGASLERYPPWEPWNRLTDIIRSGKPQFRVEQQEEAEQFFPSLIQMLHVASRETARRAAAILGAGSAQRGLRVVDVGCGSAVWSIAIAEADREARVTAQDFPAVFDTTRLYLKQHGVEDRYDFLPGDLKQVDFGRDRFDLALLGNIVHSEGERSARDLFRRLHGGLKRGGRIVIIDMIPNDERTGPPFPILFAVHMLVNTAEGGTYTLAEYRQWLSQAGFSRVETADVGSHSPLIIGFKD